MLWLCITWCTYGEESGLVPEDEERGDGEVYGRGPGGGDVRRGTVLHEAQGDVVHFYLRSGEGNNVRFTFSSSNPIDKMPPLKAVYCTTSMFQ